MKRLLIPAKKFLLSHNLFERLKMTFPYYDRMDDAKRKRNVTALPKRQQDIAERLSAYCEKAAAPADLLFVMEELFDLFDWKEGKKVGEVFNPGDDVYQAVEALIGRVDAATARRMWERAPRYPCGIISGQADGKAHELNVAMNTARGNHLESRYIRKNIVVLLNYIAAAMNGFSVWEYLDKRVDLIRELGVASPLSAFGGMYGNPDNAFHEFRKRTEEAEASLPNWPGLEYFLPPLLGQMIDSDDVESRNFVFVIQKILAGEAGRGSIFSPLLAGYLHGNREEEPSFHDWFPLWLLAYPSQIINNYDVPVKANFLWVMHNSPIHLFAFLCNIVFETDIAGPDHLESVFSWWTGIKFDLSSYGNDRRENILDITFQCLSSAQYRDDSLRGDDALRIYLSLWALACNDADLALKAAVSILESGSLEQVIPVLCFIEKLGSDATGKTIEKIGARQEFAENPKIHEFLHDNPATKKQLRLVVYPAMRTNLKPYQMPITYSEDLPSDSYPTVRSTVRPYMNAQWVE